MTPETFKTRRHALGLTQVALGNFLGLSRRQIIRYEQDDSDIPGPLAILIDILVNRKIPKLKRRKRRRNGGTKE